jgi:hypothetical protein
MGSKFAAYVLATQVRFQNVMARHFLIIAAIFMQALPHPVMHGEHTPHI